MPRAIIVECQDDVVLHGTFDSVVLFLFQGKAIVIDGETPPWGTTLRWTPRSISSESICGETRQGLEEQAHSTQSAACRKFIATSRQSLLTIF
jgi:hypothetical protein